MKVTFILKTTAHHFAIWLQYYTQKDSHKGKLDFPAEQGHIVLEPLDPGGPITGLAEISMFATRIVRPRGDVERREHLPPVISFALVPLAPELLQVTAECEETAVMDYFEELTSRIAITFPRPAEEGLETTPKDFPKRPKTLEKYRKAYAIVVKTRKRFYDRWKRGDWDNPTPKMEDHKDALAYEMGWRPCDKTLRRIIRFGDDGLLG